MLVLSRKENETIVVGDNIEITICRVTGGRVHLGLKAPRDVKIRRGELVRSRNHATDWESRQGAAQQ